MKRLPILLLLFAGCGSGVMDPAGTRPTLTEAREVCLPFDDDEAGFNALVAFTRAFRNDGLTESQTLLAFLETCGLTPETFAECVPCTTAVAAAVWR